MKPQLITKTGRERMQKMIAYLRQMPPENFDFDKVYKETPCGAVGCVVGWTPMVFPDLCKYDRKYGVKTAMLLNGEDYFVRVGAAVFQVEANVADKLFTPEMQDVIGVELDALSPEAAPTEVADMLESFLAQVDDRPE